MDPCRFVAVTSSEAAKIFNVYPQKVRMALSYETDRFLSNIYNVSGCSVSVYTDASALITYQTTSNSRVFKFVYEDYCLKRKPGPFM